MTRDEIISMAREAGFPFNKYGALKGDEYGEIDADEMFARFAELVAAATREECAALCDKFQARDVGMQPAECAAAIRDIEREILGGGE